VTSRRLLAVLLAPLALLGACGLTEDDGPKAIAPENLPPDLLDPDPGTSTTISEPTGTDAVSVFFLEEVRGEVRLVEAKRKVADRADPGDRLVALFAQPTEDEAAKGTVTSIPADTRLRAMPVLNEETGELVLDLSSEFLSIEGPELPKAFAQIVWTVTEREGVDQVRFLVDGEAIRAQDADGAEQDGPVSRTNYLSLRPVEA
jgi:spore germination protein GerM